MSHLWCQTDMQWFLKDDGNVLKSCTCDLGCIAVITATAGSVEPPRVTSHPAPPSAAQTYLGHHEDTTR